MAGGLHCEKGEHLLQSLNLCDNVRDHSLLGNVKTLVNLTVALRPAFVVSFSGREVSEPVLQANRPSKNNVDRLIGG